MKENTPKEEKKELVTEDSVYRAFMNDGIICESETSEFDIPGEPPVLPPVEPEPYTAQYRSHNGLILGLEYKYKNGRIDWEAMFNPEYFVYPNNDPTRDPLLKVDGLLELAEVRGVEYKKITIIPVSESMVSAVCEMKFIPNIDDPVGRIWTGAADATPANIGGKGYSKYLTALAETRAVGRCIRGALDIRLCTFEEIGKDELEIDESANRPISDEQIVAIEHQMKLKGISRDEVMEKIQEKYPKIDSLKRLNMAQGKLFLCWLNDKQNKKA